MFLAEWLAGVVDGVLGGVQGGALLAGVCLPDPEGLSLCLLAQGGSLAQLQDEVRCPDRLRRLK